MRGFTIIALVLRIVGGLNWGMVVLSALYQIVPLVSGRERHA